MKRPSKTGEEEEQDEEKEKEKEGKAVEEIFSTWKDFRLKSEAGHRSLQIILCLYDRNQEIEILPPQNLALLEFCKTWLSQ